MAESPADLFASIPSSSRSKLDCMIEDDTHLEQIGRHLTNWEGVGSYLGLSEGEEEEIDKDNSKVGRKRVAALRTWRKKLGRYATYRNLALAFHDAGRNDLVEVICKVLGESTATTAAIGTSDPSNGSVPSLNCPIFDERPTLQDLQLLRWNNNGETEEIRILDIVAPRWMDLGIALKFKDYELETVDQTCLKQNGQCVQKLFGLWFQRGRGYNWKVLISALEVAKFGKLAGDLKIALPLKI